jgi:tetratricopeptide (TPR) repeat protein
MPNNEKKYSDGDIIFREGGVSSSAFMISSGQVELLKNAPLGQDGGFVRLELLSAGAIIGEMGIFDNSARSTTARAVGLVTLDVIEHEGFLTSIKEQPDVALSVIGNLAERLRNSNEMTLHSGSLNSSNQISKLATLSVGPRKPFGGQASLWDSIRSLFIKSPGKRRLLEFRVARLEGDKDGTQTNFLVRSLSNRPELHVKAYNETLPVENAGYRSATFLQSALTIGRQWLAKDKADLLIWGDVNEVGTVIHLRFITQAGDADHPGRFLISDRLAIPTNFGPEFSKLLYAVSVAAITPRTETQRSLIKPLLLPALESAQQTRQELPHELMLQDQNTIQVCYGNVTALIGYHMSDSNWLTKAADAYQEVIDITSKDTDPIAWANVQLHLCRIRQGLGERANDPEAVQNTIDILREILEVYTLSDFPWEWGSIQTRIGSALYRLDSLNGATELLKESVVAYQSALRVFSKIGSPLKWSDLKHNLGQVLQVWGDLSQNPKILERAVLTCQEALQVRNRLETPMLWAATQNNLGSALFLLGRLTKDSEHLEGAAESFGRALEIYESFGAARLSRITDRNMAKAENLLRTRVARRAAKIYWKEDVDAFETKLTKSERDQIFRNEIRNHSAVSF